MSYNYDESLPNDLDDDEIGMLEMVEVETDDEDGDDDEGGGTFPAVEGIELPVGNDPDGGVLRGGGVAGTPTDEGGGRMTAAGGVGAVKLLRGIRGA